MGTTGINRTYGYARVSDKKQNLSRQINTLISQGVEEKYIFSDKASGKDFDRPQYKFLKQLLREGDTLYIAELDRLGRDYSEIKAEIEEFLKNGINLYILDLPQFRTGDTLTDKLLFDMMLNLLSYVAEKERLKNKERREQGMDNARKKGVKFGRPKIPFPKNFEDVYKKWKSGNMTGVSAMKELNLKRCTFYNLVSKYEESNKLKNAVNNVFEKTLNK